MKSLLARLRHKRRVRHQLSKVDPYFISKHFLYEHPRVGEYFALLCDKYGSDKASLREVGGYSWPAHSYGQFYSRLFFTNRFLVKKVFECGLGTNNPNLPSSMGLNGSPGASLRVWRDFFPNALIYGADIDRDILFNEDRIQTGFVDQTKPEAIRSMWGAFGQNDFDLIIDDGLHSFDAAICLFTHSIERLSHGGIYIIEDVHYADLRRFRGYFDATPYLADLVVLFRQNQEIGDNNLVVIRKP